MDTVYLDLETTGLASDDEILEIGILDGRGRPLLDTLVRPIRHTVWQEAQAIHGIGPVEVKCAPSLDRLRSQVTELVRGKRVVIYNAAFDSKFLVHELMHAASIECCMLAFAWHYGEWSEVHGGYRWQQLTTAADYVLFQWPGKAHRAIHDCMATRAVWRYLFDDNERLRIDAARAVHAAL